MGEGRSARGIRVSFVEFLIIERGFHLVQLTTDLHECVWRPGVGADFGWYIRSCRLVFIRGLNSPHVSLAPDEHARYK